jgi:GTPase SAR1 family protein
MGGRVSSVPQKAAAEKRVRKDYWEQERQRQKEEEANAKKVLLLGTGECGKSTLFKQIVKLYGKGYSEDDRKNYKGPLLENVFSAISSLLRLADSEGLQLEPESQEAAIVINQSYRSMYSLTKENVEHISRLWSDPAIKEAYRLRAKAQIGDSCAHFLDKIVDVSDEKFLPSDEDLLHVRVRTTGSVQSYFDLKDLKISVMDTGGQRNERKKWIHAFDNVSCLIFVSAMSEYDQKCFEDETTNRVEESLNCFGEIVNSRWFKEVPVVLLFTKQDLFEAKFPKVPLSTHFPEFAGSTVQEATEFLINMFQKKAPQGKEVFSLIIDTTDEMKVSTAIEEVYQILVIRAELSTAGQEI